MTPGILYELAKMDGAIVLNAAGNRVRYANVQLVPDPSIPSSETGIRHRSAERTARQTGDLVIAISQRRDAITLYKGTLRYQLQDLALVLAKANQALQTLEKYSHGLTESLDNLSALEFQDLVTLHDVATVLRRIEMTVRVGEEVRFYIAELGAEGDLLALQREELVADAAAVGLLIVRDYLHPKAGIGAEEAYRQIRELSSENIQLLDFVRALRYPITANVLETFVSPRGYRILSKVPRLPGSVVANLVERFQTLQRIMAASIEELDEVEGVGEVRARAIRDSLRRYQEHLLLNRRV